MAQLSAWGLLERGRVVAEGVGENGRLGNSLVRFLQSPLVTASTANLVDLALL